MRECMKRWTSLLLALLLVGCLCLPARAEAASTPSVYSAMSASYKSGPYYTKLMNVKLTGNQLTDLIQVAVSQLGYHESDSKTDLSGTGTGTGNCTEYGSYTKTNGEPWCASFVSWCFREAGIPTSIMPTSAGVGTLRRSVYNNGATWHSVNSGYKPKTGDLVLYESMGGNYTYYQYASRDANGVPSSSSHVGIVVSDFNESTQTYCVIDGNGTKGSVKYLTNQKLYMAGPTKDGGTMNRIQGFVTPAYTTGTGSGYNGSVVDNSLVVTLTVPTDPDYTAKQAISATNATVVSRISKTAGSSITKAGLILSAADGTLIKNHVETVTNVKDSTTVFHAWYDIQKELGVTLTPGTTYRYQFYAVVNGKTFYGNTYTFRTTGTAPSYTVTFQANGGTVSPASKTVTANNVYGDLPLPTREGYIFLGWYTAASGGTLITANTNVTLTANQTLYAQWQQGVEEEEDQVAEQPPQTEQPQIPVTGSVSFQRTGAPDSSGVETVTKNSDGQYAITVELNKPGGAVFSSLRVEVLDASGSVLAQKTATPPDSQTSKSVCSCTFTFADTAVSRLTPGTVYYHRWTAVVEGQTYASDSWKFTLHAGNTMTLQIGSPYLYVNGTEKTIDSSGTVPVIRSNRTLLPVRAVIEAMGGTVGWNDTTRTVSTSLGGKTLFLQIGSGTAWDSAGRTYGLDSAPIILNNRTMLPIRFVVEYFGGTVGWDDATRVVTIRW